MFNVNTYVEKKTYCCQFCEEKAPASVGLWLAQPLLDSSSGYITLLAEACSQP